MAKKIDRLGFNPNTDAFRTPQGGRNSPALMLLYDCYS
jgi:hypothetical protein